MADLATNRTVNNTPAEHVSDHNDAHGKINTLYNVHTSAQKLWVPAGGMVLAAGTPALTPILTNRFTGWAFDAAAVEDVSFVVGFPADWASYTAQVYSVALAGGTVRYDLQRIDINAGDNLSAPVVASDIVDLVHTANLLAVGAMPGGAVSGATAFRLERVATAGADTLAGDSYVLGVHFTKAS